MPLLLTYLRICNISNGNIQVLRSNYIELAGIYVHSDSRVPYVSMSAHVNGGPFDLELILSKKLRPSGSQPESGVPKTNTKHPACGTNNKPLEPYAETANSSTYRVQVRVRISHRNCRKKSFPLPPPSGVPSLGTSWCVADTV